MDPGMSAVPGTGRHGLRHKLHPDMRPIVAMAEDKGWQLSVASGGHFKLTHCSTGDVVTFSCTPSDRRATANARALMRRKLREAPA
jgi:hypothetical protein